MPTEKTLLISLLESTSSIGVKYLHSSLKQKGHDSTILFYTSNDTRYGKVIAQFIQEQGFTVVGVSVYSPFFSKAVGLVDAIRDRLGREVVIVMGGVHPTIAPDDCFQYCDYVCVGEAELALPKFLDTFRSGEDVDGFIKSPGGIITNCTPPTKLDELPFPEHFPDGCYITDNGAVAALDDALFKRYSRYSGGYIPIVTSRGCPYRCSYCCNHLIAKAVGNKIRKRSPQNVMDEINVVRKNNKKIHYLEFADECFMTHPLEWIQQFAALYKPVSIPFYMRSIPSYITDEKVALLADCGLSLVSLGLQSGSHKTNKKYYNRHYSTEEFIKAANALHKNRIPALYDVIVDNPFENIDDTLATMDAVNKLPSSCDIFFYSLTFYQNTLLYDIAKEHGLDLSSSKNKSQHNYDFWSREVMLIRTAQFMPKALFKTMLSSDRALRILYMFCMFVAWPLRSLKMAILFNKMDPIKTMKFISYVAFPHVKRILYPKFSF